MSSSEYDIVPRSGGLKLKKLDHAIAKKKKKKKEEKRSAVPDVSSNQEGRGECGGSSGIVASSSSSSASSSTVQDDIEAAIQAKMRERNPLANKTKAELRCIQMQEKSKEKRILDKASKTHKVRVEEFNKYLDNLTEHFDIPKVSWTK